MDEQSETNLINNEFESDTAHILANQDLIIENVLKFLPMKELHKSASVSKKWHKCVTRVKKKRKSIGWLLYNYNPKSAGQSTIADEMKENVEKSLNCFWSEPRQAIVFCSSALMEHGVPLSKGDHKGRTRRKRMVAIDTYLQSRLPPKCEMHGICADGVIGTRRDLVVQELEDQRALTCLLLPALSGLHVHTFYKEQDLSEGREDEGEEVIWGKAQLPSLEDLQQFTGIPSDKKPRLVLLFYTNPYFSIGQSKMDLVHGMLHHYGNLVVAGGVVDSFFMDNLNEANMPGGASCVHGVVFCGAEDDVTVASVLIEPWFEHADVIEQKLKRLKATHISESNSVGFMFACIGRGQHFHDGQPNVESGLFHKLFPNTPLFGFFGNGEIGYDYLPDYSQPQGDRGYSVLRDVTSPAGECPGEEPRPPTSHGYSTIFVIMSLRNA